MKTLALTIGALSLLAFAPPVRAQSTPAVVVSDCTTISGLPTGPGQPLYEDTTGKLCGLGSSTITGTADVNLKQVNGATVNVGAGAAGTGTQRVTTSTDSTIGTVTNPVGVKGVDGSAIASSTNPVPASLYSAAGSVALTGGNTSTDAAGVNSAAGSVLNVNAWGRLYNGASGSRAYQITSLDGTGTGVAATEQAGSPFSNITTGTTTTVKSGAGIFHKLVINTPVAAATITIYDNTAGSGTKIATLTLPSTITGEAPSSITYDLRFSTGLTVVTSAATDITVVYR